MKIIRLGLILFAIFSLINSNSLQKDIEEIIEKLDINDIKLKLNIKSACSKLTSIHDIDINLNLTNNHIKILFFLNLKDEIVKLANDFESSYIESNLETYASELKELKEFEALKDLFKNIKSSNNPKKEYILNQIQELKKYEHDNSYYKNKILEIKNKQIQKQKLSVVSKDNKKPKTQKLSVVSNNTNNINRIFNSIATTLFYHFLFDLFKDEVKIKKLRKIKSKKSITLEKFGMGLLKLVIAGFLKLSLYLAYVVGLALVVGLAIPDIIIKYFFGSFIIIPSIFDKIESHENTVNKLIRDLFWEYYHLSNGSIWD